MKSAAAVPPVMLPKRMGLLDLLRKLLGLGPAAPAAPRTRAAAGRAPAWRATPDRRPAPTQRRTELGLDEGLFAPGERSSLLRAAGAARRTASAWWGRRDLIPPVEDARTLLIDKAMVGAGFASPEELARIHEIGRRMDEVRPSLALARSRAEAAAAASDGERAALKAQKKAEAAERKVAHAEAVTRRRLEDITHLGRGVSAGLADRRAHVEKLRAAGQPVLATPKDLADALGVTIPRLRWLAFHSEASAISHYVRFTVKKRSGGTRELASPHAAMRRAQEWILREILDKVTFDDAAHGFVKGRSTLTNARPHVGKALVVNLDLREFFPTITFWRVKGAFEMLGHSPAVATILALLCTESPRTEATLGRRRFFVAAAPRSLPQGACTSPALSNLICRRLDSRLRGTARAFGCAYTRYADDLTFSGDATVDARAGFLLARVRHVVQDEGFEVNEKKTRVLRRCHSQRVTGIVVNERPGVPRETVRRLRAILHRASREGLAKQNRTKEPDFQAWLDGMIAYVTMVNPAQGEPLRRAFGELRARS